MNGGSGAGRPSIAWLDMASVVALLLAAGLWFWPAHETVNATVSETRSATGSETGSATGGTAASAPAGRPSDAGLAPRAAATDSTASRMVSGNVFSSTRRAPAARFRPVSEANAAGVAYDAYAPAVPAPGVTAPGVTATSDGGSDASLSDAIPRLYGIVALGDRRMALLALRAGESPRLLDAGGEYAGYRVVSIGTDRVVVATARGQRTLRLARPASRDSLPTSPGTLP